MKRNLDIQLLDLDGKPFDDKATLKSVVFAALNAPLQGDNEMSLDQQLKRFNLLQLVHKGGVAEITAEDITLIKTRAARCLSLIAVGRLCEMLEREYTPGSEKIEEKK